MKKFLTWLVILLIPTLVYAANLTDQTEDTSPTSDDFIYTVNDPGVTPADRKATIGNAAKGMTSTNLIDTADILYETELDTFAELDAQIADQTLIHSGSNIATATALAADGADCLAGSYPLGVDASGASASCTDASTEIDSIVATHTSVAGAHHTATVARTDAEIEDLAGGLFTGNTETLITATYQVADNTLDLVVDEASINHDSLTGFVAGEHVAEGTIDHGSIAGLGDADHSAYQPVDAELTTIAALTETNGGVIFAAGGAWTTDTTPALDCTDCINIPSGSSHTGTLTWAGTSILESGPAFQFGDASDATLTHTYANTGTNVSIAYSTGAMAVTGSLTATNLSGTNTGDNTVATSGDSATAFFSSGEIADAQISDTLTASDLVAGSEVVSDAEVVDTLTASNYLPLAGGVMSGEMTVDDLGAEFTAGDALTDCSTYSATGGAIFFDDSEGILKKCQDNVLTDLDTTGGTPATADISDVSVTQTELAELETIGATTISANQWTALGGIAETLTATELNLLDGITVLSGSNTGDNTVATSGDSATAFFASGEIADAQISDTLTASNLVAGSEVVSDAEVVDTISITNISQVGDISATASEINTPLDGALVTLTEFKELETIGATVISAADWTAVAAMSGTNTGDEAVASLTVSGTVELATTAEIDTGTDSTRAIPVDQLVASKRNIRWLVFNLVEAATDTAAATNIAGDFVSPIAGTILQSDSTPFYLYATNSTAGTTGTMVVDISIGGTSIMTTNKIDFDTTEKTTTTAATPPDLTTTSLSVGDIITIDIDSIHTTAAKGLTVYMAIRE